MKKIEIETECGEVSTIYVSQDVTKITIDGEEYNPKENAKEDTPENPSLMRINFRRDEWNAVVSYASDLDDAIELLRKFDHNCAEGEGTLVWLYSVDLERLEASI